MSKKPNEPVSLRTEAEAQVTRKPLNLVQPQPGEELLHELLHELRVHQIELEMQNDELRRLQAALEESRDRYEDLYEFAPVGYLTLTREGIIAEANLTAAALLGVDRKLLLDRRFASFVSPEDCDRWHLHWQSVLQHDCPHCDLALKRGDGSVFHVQMNCKKTNIDNESSVRVALTDISELKQADSGQSM